MRTFVVLLLVVGLTGCASRTTSRRTAIALGAVAAGAFIYGAVHLADDEQFCTNAFGGEWGYMHECNWKSVGGFVVGAGFGIAALAVWAHGERGDETGTTLKQQGRAQHVRILSRQAHDAAVAGDCARARIWTDRVAAIEPAAVGTLVVSDPAVRGCLEPATNRAP